MQRKGWRVAVVHTDDDRSAFSGKLREGYERMLERLRLGQVRGIVTWHPDRLHRSPKELERFIDVVEACGAGVVTVQGGEYDLGTASGRMSARIVGAVARHESEHKSERIRAKMRELKTDGKLTGGGRRPYGYEDDRLTVREHEAVIIRELTRRALSGESLLSLVRDLNARKVPAGTGGPWGLASISRLLRSLRIAGLRELEGTPQPAPWPAIIALDQHKQLQAVLSRHRKSGTRSQRSYLLTGGLVVCGTCGKAMIGRPINGVPTYGCDKARGGCGKVWVRAERVDDIVRDAVVLAIDSAGLAKRLQRSGGKSSEQALDAISRQEAKLREIEQDYAAGELERTEYRRLRDAARTRLEQLTSTFKPAPSIEFGTDNPLALAWPELPLGRRRAVIDLVLDEVRILPVGHRAGEHFEAKDRFDRERVQLHWRV